MFLGLDQPHCSSLDVAQSALRKPAHVVHETSKSSDHWHIESHTFKWFSRSLQLFSWHTNVEQMTLFSTDVVASTDSIY